MCDDMAQKWIQPCSGGWIVGADDTLLYLEPANYSTWLAQQRLYGRMRSNLRSISRLAKGLDHDVFLFEPTFGAGKSLRSTHRSTIYLRENRALQLAR
jgi:hypothetical protein